jgi:hypothetical protein
MLHNCNSTAIRPSHAGTKIGLVELKRVAHSIIILMASPDTKHVTRGNLGPSQVQKSILVVFKGCNNEHGKHN